MHFCLNSALTQLGVLVFTGLSLIPLLSPPVERSELEEIMRFVDLSVVVCVHLSVCVHEYTIGKNGGVIL